MLNNYWIYIVIGAMMWGIDGVLLTPKYFVFGMYNTTLIVFFAHLIPTIFLSFKNLKKYISVKIDKEDMLYLSLIAIFGGTFGTLSIVQALKLSEFNPYSLVILIQKSQPIFAILSAYIILKERPSKKFYIIFVITLLSIYFMTFGLNSPFSLEIKSILACLFSLIAAISFGISTTFGRKVSLKLNSEIATYYRFAITTFITLLILLLAPLNSLNDAIVFLTNKNILFLSIIISTWGLIAARIYYLGLKKTKAIYSTIAELAFPLTSVILDFVINKNILDPIRIIAAIVLLISIIYLNISSKE